MGGGVCWIDIDNDGWLDLFAVNSYAYGDVPYWERHGGLPGSGLFHNANGKFTDVSRASGADVRIRGNGCVAADLNGDGFSDLYVTSTTYDALLWNDGKGHFSEGARAAGITAYGWHSGATVGDVNGDGRPDLFVAGYADLNFPLELGLRVPEHLRRRTRPALPQRGERQARPRGLPGSRREAGHRFWQVGARPRCRVHRREQRWAPRPVCGERRRTRTGSM